MKKLLFIFGTRPESIKLAPIIRKWDNKYVINTGQHQDILDLLDIKPDKTYHFVDKDDPMINCIRNITIIYYELKNIKPDYVVVQGDTSSAYVGALAAFYLKIPIVHVEAGLRTYQRDPYPEEFYRRSIDVMSKILFIPTLPNFENLVYERLYTGNERFKVGNTIVDELEKIISDNDIRISDEGIVLITLHRRETNIHLPKVIDQLNHIASENKDLKFVYTVHPNNKHEVKKLVSKNIELIDPLPYIEFIRLMAKSHCIITDSGGIQEEAPTLGKKVLVVRESTERQELIDMNLGYLTGYDYIPYYFLKLDKLDVTFKNPFGDGLASDRIVEIMKRM